MMFFKKNREKARERELKEISEYIEHKKRMGFSAIDIKIKYKENVKILEDTGFSTFRKRKGIYAVMWK